MPKDQEDQKVIPSLYNPGQESDSGFPSYLLKIASFFGCFLILLLIVSFLDLAYSLKLISLLVGGFIIEDLHRSVKF